MSQDSEKDHNLKSYEWVFENDFLFISIWILSIFSCVFIFFEEAGEEL